MTGVLFDPGYSKFISSFMYFNTEAESILKGLKTPQQKSFRYKMLLPQITEIFEKEICFYYGCLLWATYIKYNFSTDPQKILNNSFFGRTKEELEEFDYLQEVDYLLEYVEKYPKNLSYYKCQGKPISKEHIKIIEVYKQFLIINESFINAETTADIKLPDEIIVPTKEDLFEIKNLIDQTVNDGNFERLFKYNIFNK